MPFKHFNPNAPAAPQSSQPAAEPVTRNSSGNAKRGTAPCGHPETFVLPNFVTCDLRCEFPYDDEEDSDGVPDHVDPEHTQPICPYLGCPGGRIKRWPSEYQNTDGEDYWLCDGCGRSFHA